MEICYRWQWKKWTWTSWNDWMAIYSWSYGEEDYNMQRCESRRWSEINWECIPDRPKSGQKRIKNWREKEISDPNGRLITGKTKCRHSKSLSIGFYKYIHIDSWPDLTEKEDEWFRAILSRVQGGNFQRSKWYAKK